MIQLRPVVVWPGIVDSERVGALSLACQLFFRNLLHCCDGSGRFPADAAEIRAALYWRTPAVARSHVEAWLQKTAEARLVNLYTRDGKPYGEVVNYRQRDTSRKTLYPAAPGQEEMIFAADDPPRRPRKKRNRIEGEGEENPNAEREAPGAPAPRIFYEPSRTIVAETQEQWLARLTAAWPDVNLPKQLTLAETAQRLQGKELERDWFETRWLPKTSAVVRLGGGALAAALPPEPEGWRVYLKDEYDGESWAESAAACTWASLPGNWRERLVREYGERGRRSA